MKQGLAAGHEGRWPRGYAYAKHLMTDPEHWLGDWRHIKFRDRILRYNVHEAHCLPADNELLAGLRDSN